jgi:hypothetical protein
MKDILINDNGFIFSGGDFLLGDPNPQEITIILNESPGTIRKEPLIGANAYSYLNGENLYKLKNEIKYHVKLAGNNLSDIKVNENEIEIICQRNTI